MSDDGGLELAEELMFCSLEDSPRSLREIGWAEVPSRQRVAAVLGPGLVSLLARGFVEVRRFDGWPSRWERGVPAGGRIGFALDRAAHDRRPGEEWWCHDSTGGILGLRAVLRVAGQREFVQRARQPTASCCRPVRDSTPLSSTESGSDNAEAVGTSSRVEVG
ncbi:hypothetical protein ABT008_02400 [Micromonospora sp. NPDC002389]|uniref:hypothetical protein n=1 Tax=Micromonospora sp. NPDC002389 TaxID=3154272 RepID=UPI003323B1E5